jgi:hypothetical protein
MSSRQDRYQSAVLRQGRVLTATLQESATGKRTCQQRSAKFRLTQNVPQPELVCCCDTNLHESVAVAAQAALARTPGTASGAGTGRWRPGLCPAQPRSAQLQVGPVVALVVPGWGTGSPGVPVRSLGDPSALPGRGMFPTEAPNGLLERVALIRLGDTWPLRAPALEPCAGSGAGGWTGAGLLAPVRQVQGTERGHGGAGWRQWCTRPR